MISPSPTFFFFIFYSAVHNIDLKKNDSRLIRSHRLRYGGMAHRFQQRRFEFHWSKCIKWPTPVRPRVSDLSSYTIEMNFSTTAKQNKKRCLFFPIFYALEWRIETEKTEKTELIETFFLFLKLGVCPEKLRQTV